MLRVAVVFSGALTVCCTRLLFLLITSLWTLAPRAVFTDADSIYCAVLSCIAGTLSCLHHKAWLPLAGGPASRGEHHSCRPKEALNPAPVCFRLRPSIPQLWEDACWVTELPAVCPRPWRWGWWVDSILVFSAWLSGSCFCLVFFFGFMEATPVAGVNQSRRFKKIECLVTAAVATLSGMLMARTEGVSVPRFVHSYQAERGAGWGRAAAGGTLWWWAPSSQAHLCIFLKSAINCIGCGSREMSVLSPGRRKPPLFIF